MCGIVVGGGGVVGTGGGSDPPVCLDGAACYGGAKDFHADSRWC